MRDIKTRAAMEQPKTRQQNVIPRTAVRILQRHYLQQKQERQTRHQRQPVEYATEQAQQGTADAAHLIFHATQQLQRKYALHKYLSLIHISCGNIRFISRRRARPPKAFL